MGDLYNEHHRGLPPAAEEGDQGQDTGEAVKKIIYLATMEAAKKWNMPLRD